jgi:hypothetical protein
MTTGSSTDLTTRVKQLVPKRWFRWVAPYRDAIIGGLSDSASWNYGLIAYARAQTRLATAYGIWLDIFAYDFLGRFLTRSNAQDDTFRRIIRATILQERVTRAGMINAVTMLTSNAPRIFEPWNTFDTGAYTGLPNTPRYGSMCYDVGQGGYGNMLLNDQAFINVARGSGSGVPNVDGYNNTIAGYGVGSIEYVGLKSELWGITDAMIYQLISMTKPTGTTMWVAFQPGQATITTEAGVVLTDDAGHPLTTSPGP